MGGLAVVDKAVKAYDAHSARLGTKRAVVAIDEQGVCGIGMTISLGLDYQWVDDLKAVLDALPATAVG